MLVHGVLAARQAFDSLPRPVVNSKAGLTNMPGLGDPAHCVRVYSSQTCVCVLQSTARASRYSSRYLPICLQVGR